ncbi:radical SAM protein [Candidatus Margulisiibacteriota bacterium]
MKTIKHIRKIKRPVVRTCPCAVGHVSCNYVVISHILGCPYNCSYCFLHTFYGKDEIVVYDNSDDILDQVSNYLQQAKQPLRLGTGQFSDSLALPEAVALGVELVKLFAQQKEHLFELKTKSAQVDQLLDLDHSGRTVIAWSVNPQQIVESDEQGSVSLAERLKAAKKCVKAGYPVAFHFDPIIFYPGWDKDYQTVVDKIFTAVDPKAIAWISLGALRYAPELSEIITKRFSGSRITFIDHQAGTDGKMRYSKTRRIELFRKMHELIRSHSKDVYVYLCMESAEVWQAAGIKNDPDGPFARFFAYFRK